MLVILDLNGNMLLGEAPEATSLLLGVEPSSGSKSDASWIESNGSMIVELKNPVRLQPAQAPDGKIGIGLGMPHPLITQVPNRMRVACLAIFRAEDLSSQDREIFQGIYQEAMQRSGKAAIIKATDGQIAATRRLQSVPSVGDPTRK